jgi:hypothetical protein
MVVGSVLMKPTGTFTQALDAHRRGLKVPVRVQNKSQEITPPFCPSNKSFVGMNL